MKLTDFTETGAYSKAFERRMRSESQSRDEDGIAFDEDLPLNEENAHRLLQYLDQRIAKASGEYSDFEVFACTFEKLALHIYLGNTAETVACLLELNELDGAQFSSSSEDEDELSIEGKSAHILLAWAAGGDVSEVIELAKSPDPISLLLLKAKGISLPEPSDFSMWDYLPSDETIQKQLFSRNYREAIQMLNEWLPNASEFWERELFLKARGFCNAMLGDYEGALQDYNEVIDSDPVYNIAELPLIRGLIHFLNNNREKARADLFPLCEEGITLNEYRRKFLGLGNFSGFAIAKILDL